MPKNTFSVSSPEDKKQKSSMESLSVDTSASPPLSLPPIASNTSITSQSTNISCLPNVSGHYVEEKLSEQFRYFRSEFLEAANQVGVTVPLDILEDTTGRIFNFVKYNGPKYILQMIPANLENVHLLRCSLSLLIITVTILSRKLPDATSETANNSVLNNTSTNISSVGAQLNPSAQPNWSNSITETIQQWAIESLNHLNDAGAVSVTINLMMKTNASSVHELALSFLSALIKVSDDAAIMMFHPPNSACSYNLKRFHHRRKVPSTLQKGRNAMHDEALRRVSVALSPKIRKAKREISALAGLANIEEATTPTNSEKKHGRSRSNSMVFKERSPRFYDQETNSLSSSHDASNSSTVAKDFIRKMSYAETITSSSVASNDLFNIPIAAESMNGTCLSILLSVIARNRNKYLIIGGYADLVLSMCGIEANHICTAIAMTPTCMISNEKGNNNPPHTKLNYPSKNHSKEVPEYMIDPVSYQARKRNIAKSLSSSSSSQSRPNTTANIKSNQINGSNGIKNKLEANETSFASNDWAGIKLPLMFLARFFKHDHEWHSDYLSNRQRDEMDFTFRNILLAVAQLIIGSNFVAKYVITLSGAEEVLRYGLQKLQDGFEEEPLRVILQSFDVLKSVQEEEELIHRFNIMDKKKSKSRSRQRDSNQISSNQDARTNFSRQDRGLHNDFWKDHYTQNPRMSLNDLESNQSSIDADLMANSVPTNSTGSNMDAGLTVQLDSHERIKMEHRLRRESAQYRVLNTDPNSLDYMFARSAHYAITSTSHHIDHMISHTALKPIHRGSLSSHHSSHSHAAILEESPPIEETKDLANDAVHTIQEKPKSPPIQFDIPEFPLRRGLTAEYRDRQNINMQRDFFHALPKAPTLPKIVTTDDMSRETPYYKELVDQGKEYFDKLSRTIIERIKNQEDVFINGKSVVPLSDIYRRSYGLSLVNFNRPLYFERPNTTSTAPLTRSAKSTGSARPISKAVSLSKGFQTMSKSATLAELVKQEIESQEHVITSENDDMGYQSGVLESSTYSKFTRLNPVSTILEPSSRQDIITPVQAIAMLGFKFDTDEDEKFIGDSPVRSTRNIEEKDLIDRNAFDEAEDIETNDEDDDVCDDDVQVYRDEVIKDFASELVHSIISEVIADLLSQNTSNLDDDQDDKVVIGSEDLEDANYFSGKYLRDDRDRIEDSNETRDTAQSNIIDAFVSSTIDLAIVNTLRRGNDDS